MKKLIYFILLISATHIVNAQYTMTSLMEIHKAEHNQKRYKNKPLDDLKVKIEILSYIERSHTYEADILVMKFDNIKTYRKKKIDNISTAGMFIAFLPKDTQGFFEKNFPPKKDSLPPRIEESGQIKDMLEKMKKFKIAYIMSNSEHQKKE